MNKLGKKLLVCGMAALMAGASFYTPMTVYADVSGNDVESVSYTHLDVYKRQARQQRRKALRQRQRLQARRLLQAK